MALSSTSASVSYAANGAGPYPITFKFLENEHIQLFRNGESYNVGFTLTGAGQDSGGSLTLATALTDGSTLTIQRAVPYGQPTRFREGDSLPAKNLEDSIDRPVMQIQQLNECLSRTPKAFPGDVPPTGSFKRSPSTSQGQDENGNIIARTPQQEIDHLGIGSQIAIATQAANAATSAATSAESARNALIAAIPVFSFNFTTEPVTFNFLNS